MEVWLSAEDDGLRIHFRKERELTTASFLLNPQEVTELAIALADKVAELRTGKGMWKVGKAVLKHLFDK